MNTLQDRIRGSLIGGAIGDALGYPVEFISSFEGIKNVMENWVSRGSIFRVVMVARLFITVAEPQNSLAAQVKTACTVAPAKIL